MKIINNLITFYKHSEQVITPSKAHETDAGYDIHWYDPDWPSPYKYIPPVQTQEKIFPLRTGIHVSFPPGYELQVRSKSGLASKGLVVANSPGTIDFGYTGEILVLLCNLTLWPQKIEYGQKIAQLVLNKLTDTKILDDSVVVGSACERCVSEDYNQMLGKQTTRGKGGFGSTGLNAGQPKPPRG